MTGLPHDPAGKAGRRTAAPNAAPAAAGQRRFRLTVSYDGTAYAGWQVQPRHATVQQTIETALAGIVGHACKVHGSGRTDQGVHARGQVAHVDVRTRMDAAALLRALNSRLPPDVRIEAAAVARSDFHARRHAAAKEYRYAVWNGPILPPCRRHYAAHVVRPLDLAAMRSAAAHFVGRHDFAAFSANPDREVASTVRTVTRATVARRGREFVFAVRGEGFLYRQVRSMVGFLLRVGNGREKPDAVKELLRPQQVRTARVPSAPPQGLCLWRVWYGRGKRPAGRGSDSEGGDR